MRTREDIFEQVQSYASRTQEGMAKNLPYDSLLLTELVSQMRIVIGLLLDIRDGKEPNNLKETE